MENPKVEKNTGQVQNTPLQYILKMKKGAKMILTSNIDILDSLTNGMFGEIVDFTMCDDVISEVLVEFLDPKCGEILRSKTKIKSKE